MFVWLVRWPVEGEGGGERGMKKRQRGEAKRGGKEGRLSEEVMFRGGLLAS